MTEIEAWFNDRAFSFFRLPDKERFFERPAEVLGKVVQYRFFIFGRGLEIKEQAVPWFYGVVVMHGHSRHVFFEAVISGQGQGAPIVLVCNEDSTNGKG